MKTTYLFFAILVCQLLVLFLHASEIKPTGKLLGIVPEPQRVYVFDDQAMAFKISSEMVISIPPNSPPLLNQALTMLTEDFKTAYALSPTITRTSLQPSGFYLLLSHGDTQQDVYHQSLALLTSLPPAGRNSDEQYQLAITSTSILISAPSEKGVFYGVQTLRQLFTQNGKIPAILICDWPNQDIRASYGQSRTLSMEAYIKKLAALKINMAIMESRWYARGNWWYNPTGQNLRKAREFFRLCRKYNVEPVPLIQGFGWAYGVIGINPHCSEGIWIRDEKQILVGQNNATLNHPNVLVTQAAPIVITDTQKQQTYIEGKDYKIIRGKTVPRFEKSHAPWKIARTSDSQIKDGQTVLVSYNYMGYCNLQTPYCPLEPQTYKIVDRTIQNVVSLFKPRYIHIGHDEVRYKNRCSRCQQRGWSTDKIISYDINHWYDQIKAADPSIKIMLWNDLFMDYSGAKPKPRKAIFETTPQDLIVVPWTYTETKKSRNLINHRLKLFISDHNRPTLGAAAGYTNDNIWLWKELLDQYQNNPKNLGFMFSYWGETERMWSSLNFAAEYMWSRQKPGKAVYKLYNESDLLCRKRGLSFALDLKKQKKEIQRHIEFEISAGKDVVADAKVLSQTLKQRANAAKNYLLPAIAKATFHPQVNQERLSRQLNAVSDFYQTLATKVLAQQEVHFVEIHGEPCISLAIDDLKNMARTQDKTKTTLDLGFTRLLVGVEIQSKTEPLSAISLSRRGKTFLSIDSVTDKPLKTGNHLVTWHPQEARYVKIAGPSSVMPIHMLALKKPAIYSCIQKTPVSKEWKTDAFWKNIPLAENFVNRRQGFPKRLFLSRWRTTAQATYDASNLYIRMACYFPDAKMLEYNDSRTLHSATPIWENDCVQIFIRPTGNADLPENAFNQVIVNAGGKQFTRRHRQDRLPVNITVHSEIKKDHWTSVMAIPLTWFDVQGKNLAGQTWKINFARTQRYPVPDSYSGYSSWAMLPPGTMLWFLQPNYFGALQFERPEK